ncbi:MAG: TonB-dependent receptor, partial [Gammaproteobacteria bacterium]|nr:TonB-dependent receptor [Gammaproteobacteria bacterium]
AEDAAGQSPQQQAGLRVSWDIAPDLELDLIGRYVDRLPDFDVDAYTELDARLGWQISRNFSLALVGRNLLNPHHQEYGLESLGSDPHNIDRELYLRAELGF